ncbi:PE family protein [Mycobacterium haemophilum]|uniref:PE domain-containing protein n=1 Tax=Mycobacterium haemophilum TaxID=29311 RepID=A0A0I9XFS3_9MYCO|nr:PE family protein [Mycobacterium haemophilum]KLO25562.1 hypothetical protein ABH39_19715 [Mycobacterium haemophilum]KLO34129.1 hypothetical protein ABH38_19835 [Mycobacterium haemophilum]KLO36290.1 hypothetical protein ABH37_19710 [Mycobacterium haemophilum]KLO44568.1 hypothetical protein ABH36_19505 [Mycobacterium haemophilum]MCV7341301.1 PE family protein [Mycobacterium haemophilum DSM 44634]
MPYMSVALEAMESAALLVEHVRNHTVDSNAAAAPRTIGVVPPAADRVSRKVAVHLAKHAVNYQEISAESATILDRFATALLDSANAYSDTEAENREGFV